MTVRFQSLFLFTALILFGCNPVLARDNIEILLPPDKASVKGSLVNIVCRINKDIVDDVSVTSSYRHARPLSEPVAKINISHVSLYLAEGENRICVKGYKEGNAVEGEEKFLTVFLRSNIIGDYSRTPAGFQEYVFHTPDNEKNCNICHAKELSKDAMSQLNGSRPSCYTCHRRKVEAQYVHGPAAVWACNTCHTENSPKRKNGVPDPEVMVCGSCHTEELAAWHSEKFGHGPTLAGKCAICHDAHAAAENFFLRMPASDLCGNCHIDKLLNPHVISGNTGHGHPMKQDANGRRRYISCVSCHSAHAENNQYLLLKFNGSREKFCRNCHNH